MHPCDVSVVLSLDILGTIPSAINCSRLNASSLAVYIYIYIYIYKLLFAHNTKHCHFQRIVLD